MARSTAHWIFERPAQQATCHRASSEARDFKTRSVLCHSLVVDSTFEQSENVTIAVVSLSSCCWPASRGVVYEVILIGSKFVLLHAHYWYCLDFLWVCELTVSNSCILVTLFHEILWHQTYMYLCIIIYNLCIAVSFMWGSLRLGPVIVSLLVFVIYNNNIIILVCHGI